MFRLWQCHHKGNLHLCWLPLEPAKLQSRSESLVRTRPSHNSNSISQCVSVCVCRSPSPFFFLDVCVCRPSSCTLALYLSLQRGAIDFRLRHTHTHTQSRILPLQSHSLQRLTHSMLFSPYVVLSFLAFFFSYAIGVNVSRRVFIS